MILCIFFFIFFFLTYDDTYEALELFMSLILWRCVFGNTITTFAHCDYVSTLFLGMN